MSQNLKTRKSPSANCGCMADRVSFSFWRASSWNKFIVSLTEFYVLNSMLISVLPLSSTPGSLLCLLRTHQGLPGKINNDNLVKATWKSKVWLDQTVPGGHPWPSREHWRPLPRSLHAFPVVASSLSKTGGSCSKHGSLLKQQSADFVFKSRDSFLGPADGRTKCIWSVKLKLPRQPNNSADIYTVVPTLSIRSLFPWLTLFNL